MTEIVSLYVVLGIATSASDEEIKKAYRRRAHERHPDRNPGDPRAKDDMARINLARDVLSDAVRRALYDEFGEVSIAANFSASDERKAEQTELLVVEWDDWVSYIDEPLSWMIRSAALHAGRRRQIRLRRRRPCGDCHQTGGATGTCPRCTGLKFVRLARPVTCAYCRGAGGFGQPLFSWTTCAFCEGIGSTVVAPCLACNATGVVSGHCSACNGTAVVTYVDKAGTVRIPDGAQKMRIPAHGPRRADGTYRDLVLEVRFLDRAA